MRAKTALWALPLAFFVAGGWTGICFGQTADVALPAHIEPSPAATNGPSPLFVAAVSPNSIDLTKFHGDTSEANAAVPATLAEAEPPSEKSGNRTFSRIGIGVKFSDLGVGVEAATPLFRRINVRGGFNFFRYSRSITNDGIVYDGQLHLQSGEAHLDWFPFGGFHVSPGLLFYNGNSISGTAAVPGGQQFTLGGTAYESDPATPVTGTGNLSFIKVAPSIMVGIGNLIPRNGRHFSFLFEVGAAYQGSARVALNLTGNVCDTTGTICGPIATNTTAQTNIQAQQQKIQNDVNPFRFFPIISGGFGVNF
jgi:hypothetical protein